MEAEPQPEAWPAPRGGPPAVVVAGVHSGVGKTSVAMGLMATLRRRGLRVQPFKVGPDFLDPMQHQAACGVPSVNLDGWMMGKEDCQEAFSRACAASAAQVAVIEGVMGLHDGVDGKSEAGSTAEIAKWLRAPVVLVVDAWCLSRSAAAMVLGYASFDPSVSFCGAVFNRVAGSSHSAWLREAMASAPPGARQVPLLGCLPKDAAVELKERHLGLRMPAEEPLHADKLAALVGLLEANLDLDSLLRSIGVEANGAGLSREGDFAAVPATVAARSLEPPRIRVAVARDTAFCFYYEDNLKALQAAGAELVYFSPLADRHLPPDIQALYFGGGYPEVHAAALEGNEGMRREVHSFCRSGRFCWAECGGLMYLARRLVLQSESQEGDRGANGSAGSYSMVGLLPFDVRMTKRMVMGYCHARPTASLRRLLRLPRGYALRSQQFHLSEIVREDGEPAEQLDDSGQGQGLAGVALHAYNVCFERPNSHHWSPEGVLTGGTVASYCHVHFGASEGLAGKLLSAARRQLSVASLHPSGTELLCAIPSARRRLCAVSSLCDYPPAVVSGLPRCTRSLLDASKLSSKEVEDRVQELIKEGVTDFHPVDSDWLRLEQPDVLLTQEACARCDATRQGALSALNETGLGASRALPCGATTVEEVLGALETVGAAVGEALEARCVVARMKERLCSIEASLAGLPRPSVLGLESVCPLVASGQWLPDMRIRAGGVDALGDSAGSPPRRLEWQEVIDAKADIVVICCCGKAAREAAQEVARHVLSQAGLDSIPSLQATPSKFFVVGHELLSRPGPRLVDGIEQLAALIHEGRFPQEWAGDALRLRCTGAPLGDVQFEEVCPAAQRLQAPPPALESQAWHTPRFEAPLQPPPRAAHAAVTSSCNPDDFLVFGGEETPPGGGPATRCAELWSLSTAEPTVGQKWMKWDCAAVAGESVPTVRSNHAMARWGDVLLVFGGWCADGSRPLARLELLHLSSKCWTHGSATGTSPTARGNPTLVVDDASARAVLFGGWDKHRRFADLHVLHLQEWRWECLELPGGPSARTDHVACAWPGRGMLLHGGSSQSGSLDDLWLLSWQGPTSSWQWEQLETLPSPSTADDGRATAPLARTSHAIGLLDDGVLLVTGGQSQVTGTVLSDTWLLPLNTRRWLPGPSLPEAVCRHSLVVLRDCVSVWGGYDGRECSANLWGCKQEDLLRVVSEGWALEAAGSSRGPASQVKTGGLGTSEMPPDSVTISAGTPVWDSAKPLSLEQVKLQSMAGDAAASKALAGLSRLDPSKRTAATITVLHRLATLKGLDQYVDPASGYSVFTASYLKKRACCGYGCRHCPFGHMNVPKGGQPSVVDDW